MSHSVFVAMETQKRDITCPHCGSASLYYEAGLVTGYKYHCRDCDYIGAFVIEKDVPQPKKKSDGQ